MLLHLLSGRLILFELVSNFRSHMWKGRVPAKQSRGLDPGEPLGVASDRSLKIPIGRHSSVKCQGRIVDSHAHEGLRREDFFKGKDIMR